MGLFRQEQEVGAFYRFPFRDGRNKVDRKSGSENEADSRRRQSQTG